MLARLIAIVVFGLLPQAAPEPAPKIAQIIVRGNRLLNSQAVISASGLKIGQPATAKAIEQASRNLVASGNFGARHVDDPEKAVQITSVVDHATNEATVTIVVDENDVVKGYNISGGPVPPKDILALLQTRVDRVLNPNTLRGDMERIQNHYKNKGYQAFIKPEGFGLTNNILDIPIEVGKFGGYRWDGLPKKLADDLDRTVQLKRGAYFHLQTYEQDLKRIAKVCDKHGYVLYVQRDNLVDSPPISPHFAGDRLDIQRKEKPAQKTKPARLTTNSALSAEAPEYPAVCGVLRSGVGGPDHLEAGRLSPKFLGSLPVSAAYELKGRLRLRGGGPFRSALLEADMPLIVRACERNGYFLNTTWTFSRRSPEHPWPDGVDVRAAADGVRLSFDLSPFPPSVPNRPIDDQLVKAVEKHDLPRVQALLAAGANPNATWTHKYLLLDLPRTEYIPVLVQALGWRGRHNMCSQEFAWAPYEIYETDPEIVEALLDSGANVNGQEDVPRPLSLVVQHCDQRVVKALFAAGARPKSLEDAGSLLLAAATNARTDAVQMLLDRRAPVDVRDERGRTPLIHAVFFLPARRTAGGETDQFATIKLLLDRGADIDVQDQDGMTPLMLASRQENASVIAYLTGRGADVKLRDKSGKTADDHAQEARNGQLRHSP